MHPSFLSAPAFVFVLILAGAYSARPVAEQNGPQAATSEGPSATLEDPIATVCAAAAKEAIESGGIPGVGVLVVRRSGQGEWTRTSSAVGSRCAGCPDQVQETDIWHLGSCTKAMTATLVAVLVREGVLRWDMTIEEALPRLAEGMKPGYRPVTVLELMRMRGGLAASPPTAAWSMAWAMQDSPTEQRRAFCTSVLTEQDPLDRGKYVYSNQSYALLGLICEERTGTGYEALVMERIARPLGMSTLGFGAPGHVTAIGDDGEGEAASCAATQPCGHRADGSRVEPGPHADNPPAIAPAGRAHASLADWARFAEAHLRAGEEGIPPLGLSPTDVTVLHEAIGEGGLPYAGGWIARSHPRVGRQRPMLWHNGSNTMWYAEAALARDADAVVLIAGNSGTDQARRAIQQAMATLLDALPVEKAAPTTADP